MMWTISIWHFVNLSFTQITKNWNQIGIKKIMCYHIGFWVVQFLWFAKLSTSLSRIVFSILLTIYIIKRNLKTNLIEDCVNLVHTTKEQNTYLKKNKVLFVVVASLFLISLSFKYLNE